MLNAAINVNPDFIVELVLAYFRAYQLYQYHELYQSCNRAIANISPSKVKPAASAFMPKLFVDAIRECLRPMFDGSCFYVPLYFDMPYPQVRPEDGVRNTVPAGPIVAPLDQFGVNFRTASLLAMQAHFAGMEFISVDRFEGLEPAPLSFHEYVSPARPVQLNEEQKAHMTAKLASFGTMPVTELHHEFTSSIVHTRPSSDDRVRAVNLLSPLVVSYIKDDSINQPTASWLYDSAQPFIPSLRVITSSVIARMKSVSEFVISYNTDLHMWPSHQIALFYGALYADVKMWHFPTLGSTEKTPPKPAIGTGPVKSGKQKRRARQGKPSDKNKSTGTQEAAQNQPYQRN